MPNNKLIKRRTKIVATLGPATDAPKILEEILLAGVDVVRLNCSHGIEDEIIHRVELVKKIAQKNNLEIAILLDLQGPKIRIAKFNNQSGFIELVKNQKFILDAELDENLGDNNKVGIDYKDLPNDVKAGDILLLDDGRLSLKVDAVNNKQILCMVNGAGILFNNKGINKLGGGLNAKILTDKDKHDIKLAGKLNVDYVALSFPKSAEDIKEAQSLLNAVNSKAGIISKIERAEALDFLDEIIKVSSGVMVARGDLGVEIGDAELPAVQKKIIGRARALDKVVITATQMMESMIENSLPTRAEVFDVANAVLDGTDAVMLSAETAVGKHPLEVIEAVNRVCLGAESHYAAKTSGHRMECYFNRADEAVAMAAMYVANHLDIKAIIVLTETGATPLWMSRIRSGIPIYAMSRNLQTRLKMKLYRGVYPIEYDVTKQGRENVNKNAVAKLVSLKAVKNKDWLIVARGDFLGIEGGCNTLKVLRVGEVV